ncbi:MAG: precorrin-6A/cobalt-precorrin-6A reductase [Alphaproteobacteria bacterium GM7ARS4]|nr:precorrin-6A/cobalt-precorrin-6A reductase [Alphaproteobacteria bacterium GM7ARS4]
MASKGVSVCGHVLICAGSEEARHVAMCLLRDGRYKVTCSLAGVVARPHLLPLCRYHIGGFGGIAGLCRFLVRERVDWVVDATSPHAVTMKAHIVHACRVCSVKRIALWRRPWRAVAGDRWVEVADSRNASVMLSRLLAGVPSHRRHVFLTIGRRDMASFDGVSCRFIVRSIDKPSRLPMGGLMASVWVSGRPPFTKEQDHEMMERYGVSFVVSRNSGGDATYGKIEAARMRGIPVVMIRPPPPPPPPVASSVAGLTAPFMLGNGIEAG